MIESLLDKIEVELCVSLPDYKPTPLQEVKINVLDSNLSVRECLKVILNDNNSQIIFEEILNKNLNISNWYFWQELFDLTEYFEKETESEENNDELLLEKVQSLVKRFLTSGSTDEVKIRFF